MTRLSIVLTPSRGTLRSAGLSAVRFLGSLLYLIFRFFGF